jgi:hypothetical protein
VSEAADGWALVLEFVDQRPAFAHGFEAGRLWIELERDYQAFLRTIMTENKEIVTRMCAARGWTVSFSDLADGWTEAEFERGRKPALHIV